MISDYRVDCPPQETQSSNVERLIAWLLDHTNLEVPDLASAIKDPPPVTATTEDSNEDRGEAVMVYESSSDSSESSDLGETDPEGGWGLLTVCIYYLHPYIYMYM